MDADESGSLFPVSWGFALPFYRLCTDILPTYSLRGFFREKRVCVAARDVVFSRFVVLGDAFGFLVARFGLAGAFWDAALGDMLRL